MQQSTAVALRAPIRRDYPAPSDRALVPVDRTTWTASNLAAAVAAGGMIGLGPLVAWWAPYVGAPALFGMIALRVRALGRSHALVRECDEGIAVLNAGDAAQAFAIFDGLARSTRATPMLHSVVVHNAAVALLNMGEVERALGLLGAVEHAGWLTYPRSAYRLVFLNSASWALAVRGEISLALDRLEQARTLATPARAGLLLGTEMVIALRTGRPADAEAAASALWTSCESSLPALSVRRLWAIRAFANSLGTASPARDAAVGRMLAMARPAPAGWHSAAAVHWPELRSFLVQHGMLN